MKEIHILWVDDEIDLLKPHIMFLEQKGYKLSTVTNGADAISKVEEEHFDIMFLDENMPGLSGLEVLSRVKEIRDSLPVIMITKSEEEDIMEEAIGSKIADYLIKPVNPKQILLALKKNLDKSRLISEKTTSAYQAEFGKIGMEISDCRNFADFANLYTKLVYWETELDKNKSTEMEEVLRMQKSEANNSFAKFIKRNYGDWFETHDEDKPLLSPAIFKHKVFPHLDQGQKVFFILIDNLRYDQWKTMEPIISEFFQVEEEETYSSILPTATQYSRNSIFAGLMPLEISKYFPDLWLNDEEEGQKNLHEETLLREHFKRLGRKEKIHFEKVFNNKTGQKIVDSLSNLMQNDLNVLVYNFVDMLSHSRTEMQMIRELADDESAYRSLTLSWFQHSPLLDLLRNLANENVRVVLTTDHGTIRVQHPIKVIGDKNTSTNLRYKHGRNLNYKEKEVFEVIDPEKVHLPKSNISSRYIFANNNDFIAYPNNYNYYVSYYKNTFQHGGVSMEEMILPLISLKPKS